MSAVEQGAGSVGETGSERDDGNVEVAADLARPPCTYYTHCYEFREGFCSWGELGRKRCHIVIRGV